MSAAPYVNNVRALSGKSLQLAGERPEPRPAPLLLKLGGAAIDHASEQVGLYEAICDMHQALRAQGSGVVLVHGGGAAVDRRLQKLGMTSQRRDGIRITPPDQIDEIVATLAGIVNKGVVGCIQRFGTPAVGLCLGDGLMTQSVKAAGYDFDPGCVGEVKESAGDATLVYLLIEAGFLPVFCSIGLNESGEPLNINADDAAAALASLISCRGLVLLTDVAGVMDRHGRVIEDLAGEDVERLISQGEIHGGMIPKVRGALRTATHANVPVFISSWNDHASLRRLARGGIAGTRVRALHGPNAPALAGAPSAFATTPWSDVL
jgi:acetylglutamate kinase